MRSEKELIRLEKEGVLTSGYYNDMEGRYPVFIDGDSLSDVVKDLLEERGMDGNFCYGSFGKDEDVKNPLKGKRVRLIIEIT